MPFRKEVDIKILKSVVMYVLDFAVGGGGVIFNTALKKTQGPGLCDFKPTLGMQI